MDDRAIVCRRLEANNCRNGILQVCKRVGDSAFKWRNSQEKSLCCPIS